MPFVFCTREKFPWCEFAESVENGPSTMFLKDVLINYHLNLQFIKTNCLIFNSYASSTTW